MRIVVVHNAVEAVDGPDARDVLVQVETVRGGLERLGHETHTMACTLNLDRFQGELTALRPDIVFNLVESLGGKGCLIHLVPFVMDAMGVPYSGSSAESILFTSNKLMAKVHMRAQGLPTPDGIGMVAGWCQEEFVSPESSWIIKSVWEHASIGLDETSVVKGINRDEIMAMLRDRNESLGGACFAERYVDGREFNLSLLGGGTDTPLVLPPAEILFDGYDENMPRVVDYQAKWNETSFAFAHTLRCFEFGSKDGPLLDTLRALARKCWSVFGLRGYARVDFRVDPDGQPWILEVNANPCLSPDAGFAAALKQGGIAFSDAIRIILADIPRKRRIISPAGMTETPVLRMQPLLKTGQESL